MTEQEQPKEAKVDQYETEKVAFVKYTGKMHGLSHNGALGEPYHFSRNQWTKINPEDQENYERKAAKNSHNWKIKYESVNKYTEAHSIMFKGSKAHPNEIKLTFDDANKEKTRVFVFKIAQWVIVPKDIADILSAKALNSPEVWAYQIEKVPIKKA